MNSLTHSQVRRYSLEEISKGFGLKDSSLSAARPMPKRKLVTAGSVKEGGRNSKLTSHVGSLWARGIPREEIHQQIIEFNKRVCDPPVDDTEVFEIVNSVCNRYHRDLKYTLTDLGNAQRSAGKARGMTKYCPEYKQWFVYKDGIWVVDTGGIETVQLIKETVRGVYLEALDASTDAMRDMLMSHAKKSECEARINATLKMLKSEPGMQVSADEFDRCDHIFAVKNGVFNLKTGKLRLALPEDLLTRRGNVAYNEDAKCPTWIKFLHEVLSDELVDYMQRAVGYSMAGYATEQCLFFLHGRGSNGKSTFVNTVKDLMGTYSMVLPTESLMARDKSGSSNDLARLKCARHVTAAEVDEGERLSESLIKSITGSDPITCRYLYAEFFDYVPKFKIWMTGNHKPAVRGTDDGIWRRIKMVPFENQIPPDQRDKNLERKLVKELPGILNWAVEGYRLWCRDEGLKEPQAVSSAVNEYRGEMDIIEQWVEEECEREPQASATTEELYRSYVDWGRRNQCYCVTKPKFSSKLRDKGFASSRSSNARGFKGIQVRSVVTEMTQCNPFV